MKPKVEQRCEHNVQEFMGLCMIIISQPVVLLIPDISWKSSVLGYLLVVIASCVCIAGYPLYRKCYSVCKWYRAWLLVCLATSNGLIVYKILINQSSGAWLLGSFAILLSGGCLWFGHLRDHLREAGESVA